MKNKPFLLLLSLLLCAGSIFPELAAQTRKNNRTYYIFGQAFNPVTRERLKNVFAELMTADSTVVDTMTTNEQENWNNKRAPWNFNLAHHGDRPYIVRLSAEGYRPACIDIPCQNFSKEKETWSMKEMPPVFLRRAPRERQLGEATVTATKVVFYQKGDTLVYNADALSLSEGSMLDALISQLPGVELKEGGEIYVNGRYVEQLLLNGKDFFDSDRQLMLDNLPSFMVKDVKVYDKESDFDKYAGTKVEEKKLVMDVNLKKQYHIGTIANIEAGGGTENRYMGRLFAMRFTPRSRIVAVSNINNLNDNRRPGQNTSWTPESMPTGTFTNRMGGLQYQFEDELSGFKWDTEFTGKHTSSHNYSEQSNEQFLSGGNTFGRSLSASRSGSTYLRLNNRLDIRKEKMQWSGNFWADYSRNDSRSGSASATFSDNPELYAGGHVLDSIQGPASGNLLRRLALNRILQTSKNNSDRASGGAYFSTFFHKIFIDGAFNFNWADAKSFRHYRLDYPSSADTSDFQNRYQHTRPDYGLNYNLHATYFLRLTDDFYFLPSYKIRGGHSNKETALHRLERLDGWGEDTHNAIGTLPSEAEWIMEQTYDNRNSYIDRRDPQRHELEAALQYEHNADDHSQWRVETRLPLNIDIQKVYHRRYTYDRHTRVKYVFVNPSFSLRRIWDNWKKQWSINYRIDTQVPDFLNQLLDFPNDDDPLNVTTGNPDLKPAVTHNWNVSLQLNNGEKHRMFNASSSFNTTVNAIARGFTYNPATGTRFYRPENVNGNYLSQTYVNFSMPLGKKQLFMLSSYTLVQFQHSVDLITDLGTASTGDGFAIRPSRSTVNTSWTTETLQLTFRKGAFTVGANGYAGYNHSNSRREGFVPQDVWQFNYGLTGQVELPGKIQVSTDLKIYGHRGFSDPAGNTDKLVWNARLSRHIAAANLTVMVDGFDLLRQLSNRTFYMNSQGRFETYNNTLPAYFMGHVIYRFNKQPKK